MIKNIIKTTLLLILILTTKVSASGMTSWGNVTVTYVHGDWTMVSLEGVSNNPDECSSTGYYALKSSQNNYKALHSTLLAAHMAGKQVRFWVGGCGGQNDLYPQISSVFVK